MWKKEQDNVAGEAHPEGIPKETPDMESPGDELLMSLMDRRLKKENPAVGPQRVLAPGQSQLLPAATMTTYTEALNEFAKNATAFIEQLPLLTKARDSYEQAMRAGAELRKVLDAGDENLRTLMTQLDQAVNIRGVKPIIDRKKPEAAKIEPIRGPEESNTDVKRVP